MTWEDLDELLSSRIVSPMVRRCLELVYIVLHLEEVQDEVASLDSTTYISFEWNKMMEMVEGLKETFQTIFTFEFKELVYGYPEVHRYITRVYLSGPSALTEKAIYRAYPPLTALFRWYLRGVKSNPPIRSSSIRSSSSSSSRDSERKIPLAEPDEIDILPAPTERCSSLERDRRDVRHLEEKFGRKGNFEVYKGEVELCRAGWMRLPFWITVPVRIALFLSIPRELPSARLVYVLGQHTLG